MGLIRAVPSEGSYADVDREKRDEAVSVERAGPRRAYSTKAPQEGMVFLLWTDFSLPTDTEQQPPRVYIFRPLFSAVEVAREHLPQEATRG
jgi:hypothetical protein